MRKIKLGSLILFLLLQSGCSLFFGNIRPIEERSHSYGVLNLAKDNPAWKQVSPSTNTGENNPPESGIADVAYQSQTTGSVISLNSACKEGSEPGAKKSLKELSKELLLGISNISRREESNVEVDTIPALQTTLQGQLNHETVAIRTLVLQKNTCVYDLMYVARPEHFLQDEKKFNEFIASLRLK